MATEKATDRGRRVESAQAAARAADTPADTDAPEVHPATAPSVNVQTPEDAPQAPSFRLPPMELPDDHPQVVAARDHEAQAKRKKK